MSTFARKVYTEICTVYYFKNEAPCFKMCFSPIKELSPPFKDVSLRNLAQVVFYYRQFSLQIFIHFKENIQAS